MSRKWVTENELGQEEVIEGPGVIGQYPEMYWGCQPFVYQSCCPITTKRGKMRGSFIFELIELTAGNSGVRAGSENNQTDRSGNTGDRVEAIIQPFHFDIERSFV